MKILIVGGVKAEITEKTRDYYDKYVDFFKRSTLINDQDTIVESSLTGDLIISVGDGEFSIYDTRNNRDLAEYNAFFIRGDNLRVHLDVIATINEYAKIKAIPIINDYSGVRDSSKLLQAVLFHKISAPVARTVYVNTAVINNEDRLDWTFPSILKATHGSHGNDNFVVASMDEVRSRLIEQPSKIFVLQRLVPNDSDYRILIIGDEVLVIERKAVNGSHLNNTSQGGTASIATIDSLPPEMITKSIEIMKDQGKTIGGVDALIDKNTKEIFFLEVNAQPQLMSGAFVEEKERMIAKLLKDLSHKS